MNTDTVIAEMPLPTLTKPPPVEVNPMLVIATPSDKRPRGYTFKSDPESITFHNKAKGVPRVLQCTLVEATEDGFDDTTLFFTGYHYASTSGMSMEASGLTSNVITIAFNFDGEKMKGNLTFFISDGSSTIHRMDPQVGNDPTTGGRHSD
jgi:hypothetical protein